MSAVTDWHPGDRAYLDSKPERICEVVFEPAGGSRDLITVREPPATGLLELVQISRLAPIDQ